MITPHDFLERWNKDIFGLVRFEEENLNKSGIPTAAEQFLLIAGLPESAPPFLTFEGSDRGGGFTLSNKYEISKNKGDEYIYIGFTGENDPICISKSDGNIISLDYQNDFLEMFINSTLNQLAESLLTYVEFISKIKAVNGRKAYLERLAPNELILWLENELLRIDKDSLIERSFWKSEIESYIS